MSLYTDASLIMFPSGYKEDKIYSLKPTDGSGDLTFTRASTATRVNAEGLIETASVLGSELITNGDFATDTIWVKGTGTTISGGKANLSNGNAVALYQDIGTQSGLVEVTFTVTNYTSGTLNVYSGSNQSATDINVVANALGTYTFNVIRTGGNANIIFGSLSNFTGSIDNVSIKEVITLNVPRIDYTSGCGSLLLEPQRTNEVTYSSEFNNAAWSKVNATVTANYGISPDGTQNADRIQFTTASTSSVYRAIGGATTDANSIYVKGVAGEKVLFGYGGNISVGTLFTLNGEWQRLEAISTTGAVYHIGNYSGGTATDILLYGAQREVGSYSTSYIPTLASSVTRLADTASKTGISSLINSTEGVLYAEIAAFNDQTLNNWISISEDANINNNQFNLRYVAANNLIQVVSRAAGLGQDVVLNYTLTDKTALNKIAIKYKVNDWALWVNGVEVDTETSSTAFTANSLDVLDFNRGNDSNYFFGNIQSLMVFPSALSDTELATLTTL